MINHKITLKISNYQRDIKAHVSSILFFDVFNYKTIRQRTNFDLSLKLLDDPAALDHIQERSIWGVGGGHFLSQQASVQLPIDVEISLHFNRYLCFDI